MAAIGVRTSDYRFLTGRELVKSYAAPLLYGPPAYRTTFCSVCGSPVPVPDPEGEWFEIPAGAFDDDPGVRTDRHIFVELVPAWDEIRDDLPKYTFPQLHRLRTGQDLPDDFEMRTHASARPQEDERG